MKRIILLFITLLCFISCGKDLPTRTDSDDSGQVGELIPLKVGNFWEYQLTDIVQNKVFIQRWSVTSQGNGAKGPVFNLDLSEFFPGLYLVNNRDGGFFSYDVQYEYFNLLFKYPTKVGESFDSDYNRFTSWWIIGTPNYGSLVTESLDATVTVPAGTFTGCIKYIYGPPSANIYVKAGVGLIKETFLNGHQVTKRELSAYKVN